MSLYHEAADILTAAKEKGGSLKSLVFGKKTWKSDPATLYALTTEAAKWSDVLSEVVERSGVLKVEKSLTPTLALLLIHDLFLSKKGIALPATHGLNGAASRHKVRLSAELTKARLRRGFATLDALREDINAQAANGQPQGDVTRHPRWIRINTIKSALDEELSATFTNYTKVSTLREITHAELGTRVYHIDEHIPNLIAIMGPDDPTTFKSYKTGKIILQEKASCFPAYLLDPEPGSDTVIDACAAPGNKTTHVAAILGEGSEVVACEKDAERSKTLRKMVKLAGADDIVTVKPKQNFMHLNPESREFADVTALLLDPSCSGSGIFGRDEASITVHLPSMTTNDPAPKCKKRKRGGQQKPPPEPAPAPEDEVTEETPDQEAEDESKLQARLENLSTFQLRLLQHAMSFPAARRITYSTCSIHAQENENVVVRALLSDVAREGGWRVLKRGDQVDGLRKWHFRGSQEAVRKTLADLEAKMSDEGVEDVAEACIRCDKGGEDGTMGFFVSGFVRDAGSLSDGGDAAMNGAEEEDEWSGFSDNET